MKFAFSLLFLISVTTSLFSEDVLVWKGKVHSDGTSTPIIRLQLGKKYKVKVSGFVNLGNWVQEGEHLLNDACYEFSHHQPPRHNPAFKASAQLDVCDGKFHEDHVYEGKFTAVQSGIHFWIYDFNYRDNSGELDLDLYRVD